MRKRVHRRRSKLVSLGMLLVFLVGGSGVVFGGGSSLLLGPTAIVKSEAEQKLAATVDVGAVDSPEVSITPAQVVPVLTESSVTTEATWHMVESESIPVAPVAAHSAIVIDDKSGEILAAKNADQRLAMASITKLMTAWVALDKADMKDKIRVSAGAASTPPTHLPLQEGDVLTVEELLHALLLTSANDAAVAIKDGLGGPKFIEAMNLKAKQMGLVNTHFANTTGFDAPGHYSSSSDLAKLAHHVYEEYPQLLKMVQKKEQHYPANGGRKAYHMPNFHQLVGVYPGYLGGKPGYTGNAGMCLLTVAQRGGERVMVVVLNSPDVAGESMRLLDYGFERIK